MSDEDEKLTHSRAVLNADQIGKSIPELISLGCHFVVEGEHFQTMISLLEKLLIEGTGDDAANAFLIDFRQVLLTTSKPVRTKIGMSSDKNIEIVSSMPSLPKIPQGSGKRRRKH